VAGRQWNRGMTELTDPAVRVGGAREIAPDLLVIPNDRVDLVPNIGLIGGTEATGREAEAKFQKKTQRYQVHPALAQP